MKKGFLITALKVFLIAALIFVAMLILLDFSFLLRGSLEMSPNGEQLEKGRIGYALFLVILMIIEGFLAFVTARVFKKK